MPITKRSDAVTIWWIYFVICKTGRIYTGISPDPHKRFRDHQKQTSANMRMNEPQRLLGAFPVGAYRDAVRMERRIKRMPAELKVAIASACGERLAQKA